MRLPRVLFFVVSMLFLTLAPAAYSVSAPDLGQYSPGILAVAPVTCSPAPCIIPEGLIASGNNWSNFVVNPTNTQQFLSGGSGSIGCPVTGNYVSFSSSDQGSTWTQTCLPPLLTSNPYLRPPTFAYDLNSVAYAFYQSENNVNFYDIVMSTSLDNGKTWKNPSTVVQSNFGNLSMLTGTVDANAGSPFANSIYVVEGVGDLATGGAEINVLSSHDGGKTFQTVTLQPDTTQTIWGIYAEIATGKDGSVYLTYRLCNPQSGTPCKIMFSRSSDGGTTWTKPRPAASVAAAPGQTWPNTSINGQYYAVYQSGVIAVDNSSGRFAGKLYLVTYNWTGSAVQVVLTSSTNGGKTWGPLVPLSPITNDQFWPWLTVSSSGAVGVTWLDRRDDPANLKYRAYLTISTDGGTTFGVNLPIDNGLEDPTNVYAGILSTGNVWIGHTLYATWFSHGTPMGTVVGGAQFK
jgi:hypothetical protein